MNWNQSNNNLFLLHISFWRIKHYGSIARNQNQNHMVLITIYLSQFSLELNNNACRPALSIFGIQLTIRYVGQRSQALEFNNKVCRPALSSRSFPSSSSYLHWCPSLDTPHRTMTHRMVEIWMSKGLRCWWNRMYWHAHDCTRTILCCILVDWRHR